MTNNRLPWTDPCELSTLIREEIARQGAVPFGRFMELALYHPRYGYYERRPRPIGRGGDFYTSVSVGALFGQLLGLAFAEWNRADARGASQVGPWQIVEAGAHDGGLAADVLDALRHRDPAGYETLEYWVVEPSPRRATLQQARLRGFAPKVRWWTSLEALPSTGVRGVVLCNELLDAFPVRRWGWDAAHRRWFEWGVTWLADRFSWARLEPASPADQPLDLPLPLQAVLPDGFSLETCPAAEAWWRQAATALRRGHLVAFDYGLTEEEWLAPHRPQGTLRAYRNHQLCPDVLADPGDQDLTAHVNFSRLQAAGEALGLRTAQLSAQGPFLVGWAQRLWQRADTAWSPEQLRQFQTLTHPGFLGRSFQVLVQERCSI